METNERTRDIYEQIDAYPKPPLMPLPEIGDLSSLEEIGLKGGSVSRRVVNAAMAATGFKSFQRQLPNTIEDLLRRVDLRGSYLFAPPISATVALADDPRNLGPIERAATLLFAARSLCDDVFSGRLPPDQRRGQVLEMGQYPNLFSTSLIVERAGPRIFKSANFSQITVVVARRFYLLKIGDLGPETTIEQLEEALTGLVQAAQHNRLQADEPAPGILTCADHATQCKAFRQLQKIGINVESLSAIRHSLLTLCLDLDSNPASYAEAAYLAHSGNCANRWHHSSLQLVVFGNAKACAICSFSAYLDGNTMMRAAAEIQKRAAARPLSNGLSRNAACLTPAVELRWQISGDLIRRARQDLQTVLDNQQATFEIEGLGQSFFAAHAVEPIPAFVVALAMTTKQLTGRAVGIVQFLAASKYRCLGLAVASVSTPEVKRFVDYLDGDDAQHAQTAALLREAIISQERECRKVRQRLPLAEIIALFVLSKKGVSRLYVTLVVALAFALLRLFGLYRPVENEVAVSHPVICPEAPVVGRPGARLPYQKYFGLHYQILEDRIIVTVMPSVRWMIPNVELIAVLSENLKRIQGIVEGAQR